MILARAVARLLQLAWMIVLAAAGVALAAYCADAVIGLGSERPDRLLHLPLVRTHVGHTLRRLGDPGPVGTLGLAGGIIAMLLAIVLLVGLLAPRRPRLITLASDDDGVIAARLRAVADMLRDRAASVPEVARVSRPRVTVGRRHGRARLTVVPSASGAGDPSAVRRSVQQAITPVTDGFALRARIAVHLPRKRS